MTRIAAAVFVLLGAGSAFAQDEHIGLRVREWFARTSGTISSQENGIPPTSLDLSDDLGLGDQQLTHEIQVYGRIPFFGRLVAGWWHSHDEGHDVLSETISFAGQTFTQSTPIDTEYTLDVAYLNYELVLPTIPLGDLVHFEIAPSLGVTGIWASGNIQSSALSGSDSGKVGLPTVGLHATVKLFDLIRTEAEVRGLQFRYGDHEAHYLEAYGEAVVEPLPFLFAGVGYKLVQMNVKNSGNNPSHVDLDIAGFYITFGVRF